MNKSPSSLYIHIPFCEAICDYCDFPKLQYFRNFALRYIEKLKEEIASYHVGELKTIYIGGGTPTALEDDLFEDILSFVFPYTKGVEEYTIEANPESLSLTKLKLMKKYGVNRLSIGVESTDDKILSLINRHHTYQDVVTAINNAISVGIDNINVDLILGLPHVKKDGLKKDLDNLLSLPIKHLSCYSLSVHPHTVFYLKGIQESSGDQEREYYDLVEEMTKANGFIHYEVSNFAKPGYESKHNYVYWKDEQYYGCGLGAAGYIGNIRYTNTRSLDKYLIGEFIEEKEVVELSDDKEYFLMLNLRTIRGVILKEYQERFNEDFYKKNQDKIDSFIKRGLLIYDRKEGRIYPTYQGMMILDTMLLDLFNENGND